MKEEKCVESDRRITLRFKFDEWVQIEADIKTSGKTINEYFRQLAVDAPVPRKRRTHPAVRADVGKFLGELGKIGSNVNQLARQANRADRMGNWALMPGVNDILIACDKTQRLLGEVRDSLEMISRRQANPKDAANYNEPGKDAEAVEG